MGKLGHGLQMAVRQQKASLTPGSARDHERRQQQRRVDVRCSAAPNAATQSETIGLPQRPHVVDEKLNTGWDLRVL